jgi:hypothetical protein
VVEKRVLRRYLDLSERKCLVAGEDSIMRNFITLYASPCIILLLSLALQPSLCLGPLLKIRLNFLEASQQFSFTE